MKTSKPKIRKPTFFDAVIGNVTGAEASAAIERSAMRSVGYSEAAINQKLGG